MNSAQVRAKARMAMKRREDELETEEMESGELNLVPYLDMTTNIMLFLLATVTSGAILGNINSALPQAAGSEAGVSPTNDDDPHLIISITPERIILWSQSGLEGTIDAPKLAVNAIKPGKEYDYTKLTAATQEIVKRRWPDKKTRNITTEQIILQADRPIPYHVIIGVMDAVRETPDGTTLLFPDVLFSTGFR